jgi:hypothetical protein
MEGEEEETSEAIISAERGTSTVDRSIMRRCLTTLLKPDAAICRYVKKHERKLSGSPSRLSLSRSHAGLLLITI